MKKIYGFNEIKKNIVDSFVAGKLHHCNLINGELLQNDFLLLTRALH